MTDKQCPSCGGFCKKECERADVKQPEQEFVACYDVNLEQQAYDRGFEDGCAYERQAILDLVEITGMTPADIARVIRDRGIE